MTNGNADFFALLQQRLHNLFRHLPRSYQEPAFKSGIAREGLVHLAEQLAFAQAGRVAVLLAFEAKPSTLLTCVS